MNTKVVHHTYPGTMSATELASLQPMQHLKTKFPHQKPGFQSSRDWKEDIYIYIYIYNFCFDVYIHVCGILFSNCVPIAWGSSATQLTHRLPKGRFTLRWRSPPVMKKRAFLNCDWSKMQLLTGGCLH